MCQKPVSYSIFTSSYINISFLISFSHGFLYFGKSRICITCKNHNKDFFVFCKDIHSPHHIPGITMAKENPLEHQVSCSNTKPSSKGSRKEISRKQELYKKWFCRKALWMCVCILAEVAVIFSRLNLKLFLW